MAASNPLYDYGDTISAVAGAAVTGARFVTYSATMGSDLTAVMTMVGTAGAAVAGVAASDAASGAVFTVHRSTSIVAPVTAGTGGLTAGGPVKSDATGQAIAQGGTGNIVGYAMNTCLAGELCYVDRAAR